MSTLADWILPIISYLQQNTTSVTLYVLVVLDAVSNCQKIHCNPAISMHSNHLSLIIQTYVKMPSEPCCLSHPTLNIWQWMEAICLITSWTRTTRYGIHPCWGIRSCHSSLPRALKSPIFTWIAAQGDWMFSMTTYNSQPKKQQQQYRTMMISKLILGHYVIIGTAYQNLTMLNTTWYWNANRLWNTFLLVILSRATLNQSGKRLQDAFYPIQRSNISRYLWLINPWIGLMHVKHWSI